MNAKERIYISFAKFFPASYGNHIKQMIMYSGSDENHEYFLGSSLIFSILVFLVFFAAPWAIFGAVSLLFTVFGIAAFGLVHLVYYMVLYFKVEDRAKRVEKVLPDALQLISANLRAGMTPFNALKLAARKEFGPLEEEIKKATGKAFGTENFSDALLQISKRIRSELLSRSMRLFTTAMKSGGQLARLLEELGMDIAETNSLKKELKTNTRTYLMFIMFTIVVGTPLLLALSIHFVEMVEEMQSRTPIGTGFGMSFLSGDVAITPDFLFRISIAMLVVTSLLASMLMGVIAEGKMKYGLRFSVPIIVSSLLAFGAALYTVPLIG